MTATFKFGLKIFLTTGLIYAIFMAIAGFLTSGHFSLFKFLFHGFGFGSVMAASLVGLQVSRLKELGIREFSDKDLRPRIRDEFYSDIDSTSFIEAIQNDKLLGKMKLAHNGNSIKLVSRASGRSWGEVIEISSTQETNGSHHYVVSNKPWFPLTIIDFGKGAENMLRVKSLLASPLD